MGDLITGTSQSWSLSEVFIVAVHVFFDPHMLIKLVKEMKGFFTDRLHLLHSVLIILLHSPGYECLKEHLTKMAQSFLAKKFYNTLDSICNFLAGQEKRYFKGFSFLREICLILYQSPPLPLRFVCMASEQNPSRVLVSLKDGSKHGN